MDLSDVQTSNAALVLAGGIALGAYEAGACAALFERPDVTVDWVAGVSVGAVNAAVIAGWPPGQEADRLRCFWRELIQNWHFLCRPALACPDKGCSDECRTSPASSRR